MPFAIYPPIGLARIGNSLDEYFVGRESRDSMGIEILGDGTEQPVSGFKDSGYRMKRQGARFRIFDISDPTAPVEATFPEGTVIRWSVTLANKKDAVKRPNAPPETPIPIVADPARSDRLISATATVEGMEASPEALNGVYMGEQVTLGHLVTDKANRLIVLGGTGRAESLVTPPASIGGSFYNNPDWFDDVGDGPVTATIEIPGNDPENAKPAWVITAPPDFAPPSNGVVTLYDILKQVAIDEDWLEEASVPNFDNDIRPMIERTSSLQHVDEATAWTLISQDWERLADSSNANQGLRKTTALLIGQVENALHDFELSRWQRTALEAWVDGNFDTGALAGRGLCDELTRAALDGGLGQGLYPGIEAGTNILNPAYFDGSDFEFRLLPSQIQAGDLTALMALPWQADFLKCGQNWWPAQRPYRVLTSDGSKRPWMRPSMSGNHQRVVNDVQKLGVLTAVNGQIIEKGRDEDGLIGNSGNVA